MKKKESNKEKRNKGFTLIEILVVVLIIGVLAAIALPHYQLAVDKARYAKMMDFTKAIAEAEIRALMVKEEPTFKDLDIDIPANCKLKANDTISCDDGIWGCNIINKAPRCSDLTLKTTYLYYLSSRIQRVCYTHTTNTSDRANRLCQALTNEQTPFSAGIYIFSSHSPIGANGYYF